MKLPCERYILFLYLKGEDDQAVSDFLRAGGYIDGKISPELSRYLQILKSEAEENRNSGKLPSFLRKNRLVFLWHNKDLQKAFQLILDTPSLRFDIETYLTALPGGNEAIIERLRETKNWVLKEEVLEVYRAVLWDLQALSPWEIEMLFESHLRGKELRQVYGMGLSMAALYGLDGGKGLPRIDRVAELRFIRAVAAAKLHETARIPGPRMSPHMLRFSQMFFESDDRLKATETISDLIEKVNKIKPLEIPLEVKDRSELETLSGATGGLAVLSDVSKILLEAKGEES